MIATSKVDTNQINPQNAHILPAMERNQSGKKDACGLVEGVACSIEDGESKKNDENNGVVSGSTGRRIPVNR